MTLSDRTEAPLRLAAACTLRETPVLRAQTADGPDGRDERGRRTDRRSEVWPRRSLAWRHDHIAPAVAALNGKPVRSSLAGSPKRFINRELSWLAFNELVLEEATNPRHPLLERLRFLSISANNLDEFYMVRVAGLRAQIREGVRVLSQDGLSPGEQLVKIDTQTSRLMAVQQSVMEGLQAEMADEGLRLMEATELTGSDRTAAEAIFLDHIFPVVTPLAIDPAHPFPFIPNLGFSLALKLHRKTDHADFYALVPVPTQVARFWELPPGRGSRAGARSVGSWRWRPS